MRMLLFHLLNLGHEWKRARWDGISLWLANRLPPRLVTHCALRAFQHAISGPYATQDETPCADYLPVIVVLDRWLKDKEKA